MIKNQEKAFFNWLRNHSQRHWHYTDVKAVRDWITDDKKLQNVQSIQELFDLMKKDNYFKSRHFDKVERAYEYFCQRILAGKLSFKSSIDDENQ